MRHRGLTLLFILIATCIGSGVSYSQSSTVTNGLTYLTATQSPDGSWPGTVNRGALSTTTNVVESLSALGQQNTPMYANAVLWLQAQSLEATEELALRIHALSIAGTDNELLISNIDEIYTGAWGGDDSPDVDNLDTLLALQALKKINYHDQNIISTALYNLTSNQNPGSGWGFRQGDDSEVYYTALVLQTLAQFKTTYDLNSSITSATAYLLAKQNPDGGFGSPASTAYETAMAVMALIESGASDQQSAISIQHGLNYLSATQLPQCCPVKKQLNT